MGLRDVLFEVVDQPPEHLEVVLAREDIRNAVQMSDDEVPGRHRGAVPIQLGEM